MPSFTDLKGREWDLTITLAAAERIDNCDYSDLTKKPFSILSPSDDFFTDCITNTPLIFAMIWNIINKNPNEPIITQEEFKDSLNGTLIYEAKERFWEALVDFFPEMRITLSELVNGYKLAQRELDKRVSMIAKEQLTPYVSRAIEREEKKLRGKIKEAEHEAIGAEST